MNPPHTMIKIPNATAFLQVNVLNTAQLLVSPVVHLQMFLRICDCVHVLSMLLVSSNYLTHIQILFVSWTAFLYRIMILRQKALWVRSQICCFWNTPVSKSSIFICPNHNSYWNGVYVRSEQNYIHSPTPTTARILPFPNCLVLSAAPCIIFTSTMIKIYTVHNMAEWNYLSLYICK